MRDTHPELLELNAVEGEIPPSLGTTTEVGTTLPSEFVEVDRTVIDEGVVTNVCPLDVIVENMGPAPNVKTYRQRQYQKMTCQCTVRLTYGKQKMSP